MEFAMIPRIAWTSASVLLLACSAKNATVTNPSPARSTPSVRIALTADARTLSPEGGDSDDRARERLSQELNRVSGHNVIVFRKTSATPLSVLELDAAEQNASVLLFIRHASGSPNSFITVTLRSVETGDVVAETALHRGTTTEAIDALSAWYASVAGKVSALSPGSSLSLLKRFAAEGRCADVVALMSRAGFNRPEDSKEAETAAQDCRRTSRINAPAPTVPLRVRAENVDAHFQSVLFSHARDSNLVTELQGFYRQAGELVVVCGDNCARGKIQLSLPYDPDWYKEQNPSRELPLSPYHRLARALIEYRASLKNTIAISNFPIEVALTSPYSTLLIGVQGPAEKPRLTTKSDVPKFLSLEP
jgi:hypothetical protein